MRWLIWAMLLPGLCSFLSADSGFKKSQLLQARVQTAYRHHYETVQQLFRENEVPAGKPELFIRILKREKQLEVWAKGGKQAKFRRLRQYPFCAVSGKLGPKRQQGDGQIPEGFYIIDRFHPTSNYHLSLGLDYPNVYDQAKCLGGKPGGNIFIHGGCVTIGCVPITDTLIEELYVLAVEARNGGQMRIPVHVFPCRLTADGMAWLNTTYSRQPELLAFWNSLQPGYTWFEENLAVPQITVSAKGYSLQIP